MHHAAFGYCVAGADICRCLYRGDGGSAFQDRDPLFKTGIAGLIAVPTLGWVMVAVYNRVHMEETVVDKMVKKQAAEKSEEDGEKERAEE